MNDISIAETVCAAGVVISAAVLIAGIGAMMLLDLSLESLDALWWLGTSAGVAGITCVLVGRAFYSRHRP